MDDPWRMKKWEVSMLGDKLIYYVNVLRQYMRTPTNIHMQAAKRILCFLKKNPGKCLLYAKQEGSDLEGKFHAD